MKMSPAVAGAVKGLVLAIIFAITSFLENQANLNGVVNPSIALVIAALASGLESHLKAESGGNVGLFGTVKIK